MNRQEELRIQALGAAVSRRDWHAVEVAHAAIRDAFYAATSSTPAPAVEDGVVERVAEVLNADKYTMEDRWEIARTLAAANLLQSTTPPAALPGQVVDWKDFAEWCEAERHAIGAVDGYDYRSGEEYGLRRAQIQAEQRYLNSLVTATPQAPSQVDEARNK